MLIQQMRGIGFDSHWRRLSLFCLKIKCSKELFIIFNKYLHIQLDTCRDVNLMPESVYRLVFNDPQISKLAKNDIDLTAYTRHSVDLIGKCTFYMLSKGMRQAVKVDFYIAKEEGIVFLSQETVFQLQLLDVKPRLEYLPPEQHSYPVQWIIPKGRYMHSLCLQHSQIQHPSYLLPNLKYPKKTHWRKYESWSQRSKFRNSAKNPLKA